jgi:hypothetical protein
MSVRRRQVNVAVSLPDDVQKDEPEYCPSSTPRATLSPAELAPRQGRSSFFYLVVSVIFTAAVLCQIYLFVHQGLFSQYYQFPAPVVSLFTSFEERFPEFAAGALVAGLVALVIVVLAAVFFVLSLVLRLINYVISIFTRLVKYLFVIVAGLFAFVLLCQSNFEFIPEWFRQFDLAWATRMAGQVSKAFPMIASGAVGVASKLFDAYTLLAGKFTTTAAAVVIPDTPL